MDIDNDSGHLRRDDSPRPQKRLSLSIALGPSRTAVHKLHENLERQKQNASSAMMHRRILTSENTTMQSQLESAAIIVDTQKQQIDDLTERLVTVNEDAQKQSAESSAAIAAFQQQQAQMQAQVQAQIEALQEQNRVLREQMESHNQTRAQDQTQAHEQWVRNEALRREAELCEQTTKAANEELSKKMAAREDDLIQLRAQLRLNERKPEPAASRRKTRSPLEILQSTPGMMIDVPLDPVPIPSSPAPAAHTYSSGVKAFAAAFGLEVEASAEVLNGISILTNNGNVQVVLPGSEKKKARAKRSRAVTKDEVKPASKELQNKGHAMVRHENYKWFGVKQASDFVFRNPPTEETVDAFAADEMALLPPGAQWDFNKGYQTSAWNEDLMAKILAATAETDRRGPDYIGSGEILEEYLAVTLLEQLERVRGEWKLYQPRFSPALGRMELLAEARARGKYIMESRRRASARNNGQHRTYDYRVATVEAMIYLKQELGSADVEAWVRFLKLLELLGAEGMSEEEAGTKLMDGAKVAIFKIKICIWREPAIAEYMRIIDAQMEKMEETHTGKRRVTRDRTDEKGTRRAVPGLPQILYNQQWLASRSAASLKELRVSKEVFALFVAATERMGM